MFDAPNPAAPVPAVAPVAAAPRRHAWGLPAGSIRALLALAVLGLLWAVALIHTPGEKVADADKHLPMIMISLQILMVLILVHFFTAHGKTIGRHISTASPLGLPGGWVRFILAAGWIGLGVFLFYNHADFELPEKTSLWSLLLLLVVVLICYFAGMILSAGVRMMWGDPPPGPYQDLEAWVAMIALVILGIIVLMHLIRGSLSAENKDSLAGTLDVAQAVVSGLIGLYFGARS
jgi:hypothetical protein